VETLKPLLQKSRGDLRIAASIAGKLLQERALAYTLNKYQTLRKQRRK